MEDKVFLLLRYGKGLYDSPSVFPRAVLEPEVQEHGVQAEKWTAVRKKARKESFKKYTQFLFCRFFTVHAPTVLFFLTFI